MQTQAPPSPPVQPTPVPTDIPVRVSPGTGPADIYQAMVAQRRELVRQLGNLEDRRGELRQELSELSMTDPSRKGIVDRIAGVDQRIGDLDRSLAEADAAVARAAAVPGATVQPVTPRPAGPPEELIYMSVVFAFVLMIPFVIAYARRIWRRGAAVVQAIPDEIGDRLSRIEHAVDAIAVEVERLGEGQRYMTRVFGERSGRALGEGAAEPLAVPAHEAAPHTRR